MTARWRNYDNDYSNDDNDDKHALDWLLESTAGQHLQQRRRQRRKRKNGERAGGQTVNLPENSDRFLHGAQVTSGRNYYYNATTRRRWEQQQRQ